MSGFLLDTNCISEVIRVNPNPGVAQWINSTDESILYLSVLTLGEIGKGIAALGASKKRSKLQEWLELDLKRRFAGRLLTIDDEIAYRWGVAAGQAKLAGHSLGVIDGLLAATAIHHNLTLVTRNTTDFAITHVPMINPWQN